MTAALQTLGADPVPRKKLKLRRRALNIGKEAAEAILASPPSPPRDGRIDPEPEPAGPPPIEVEYVFGGTIPDGIVPVVTIAVLTPKEPPDGD